ncbi:MAG: barstar family protein [Actinobacteria bacterium]|jgi:RNAse (barnase) inhibitor barstar|nr:barstar family protein [Micrococcales bacterium]MCB0902869.1 barstar family protein [Actinomycetota bacterium]MCB9427429.1 barstar family protein [Actinomycetota bacterium]MCO5298446.1 barstar family protein [Candidatus Nanopelagicales bacterium]HRV65689.1 barstar family protein [Candidatus Nanopelagicales bacterium]
MSLPEVVVLDTRGALDKQSFLTACARSLAFPDYFGHNWDALADSLGEFARERSPVLVVWTGASDLDAADRATALEIMSERFIDGADLLIVDDVHAAPAPDYALDHVQVAIPPGAEQQASAFWVDVVGLTLTDKPPQLVARGGVWLTGDALNLHLGVDSDFRPATKAHPGILVRDYDALLGRLSAAGYETRTGDEMPGRFHTHDPFGNRIEFIAF